MVLVEMFTFVFVSVAKTSKHIQILISDTIVRPNYSHEPGGYNTHVVLGALVMVRCVSQRE